MKLILKCLILNCLLFQSILSDNFPIKTQNGYKYILYRSSSSCVIMVIKASLKCNTNIEIPKISNLVVSIGNDTFTGNCSSLYFNTIDIKAASTILGFKWVAFNESSFPDTEIGWSSTGSDRSQPIFKYKLSSIEFTYEGLPKNGSHQKSLITEVFYLSKWYTDIGFSFACNSKFVVKFQSCILVIEDIIFQAFITNNVSSPSKTKNVCPMNRNMADIAPLIVMCTFIGLFFAVSLAYVIKARQQIMKKSVCDMQTSSRHI